MSLLDRPFRPASRARSRRKARARSASGRLSPGHRPGRRRRPAARSSGTRRRRGVARARRGARRDGHDRDRRATARDRRAVANESRAAEGRGAKACRHRETARGWGRVAGVRRSDASASSRPRDGAGAFTIEGRAAGQRSPATLAGIPGRAVRAKRRGGDQSSSGHMIVITGSPSSPGPIPALSVISLETPPIRA